jgi:hypothetical protein
MNDYVLLQLTCQALVYGIPLLAVALCAYMLALQLQDDRRVRLAKQLNRRSRYGNR